MKQKLALMTVLFLLVGGALYAQQDMGNAPAPQATYVTGTVQSVSPTSLTVQDESGQSINLTVNSSTVGAQNLNVGDRVRVEYTPNTQGQNVAEEVQANPSNLAESSESSSATSTSSATATTGTEPESAATEQQEEATEPNSAATTPSNEATEPNTYSNEPSTTPSTSATPQSSASSSMSEESTAQSTTNEQNTSATSQAGLPRTGSNLPAIALLGLLALAGAVTVRFLH